MAAAKAARDADNPPQAVALYQDAAETGSAEAASRFAQFYLEGGDAVPADPVLAGNWAEKAAAAGESRARMLLGKIWIEGQEGTPDLETALAWFRKADTAGI